MVDTRNIEKITKWVHESKKCLKSVLSNPFELDYKAMKILIDDMESLNLKQVAKEVAQLKKLETNISKLIGKLNKS